MRVNWCAFIFCASFCVSKEKNLQKLCQTYTLCNFLIVYGARVAKNLHIEEGFWRIFQCENSMILLIRMTLPKLTVLMQPLDVKILCLQFLVDYASMLLAYLQFIRADSQQIQSFIVNVVMFNFQLSSNKALGQHIQTYEVVLTYARQQYSYLFDKSDKWIWSVFYILLTPIRAVMLSTSKFLWEDDVPCPSRK